MATTEDDLADPVPTDRDTDRYISVRETVQWLVDRKVAVDSDAAPAEILRKLRADEFRAYVPTSMPGGDSPEVHPLFWVNEVEIAPLYGNVYSLDDPYGDPLYSGLVFERADVLRLWPAAGRAEPEAREDASAADETLGEEAAPPVDPYRSGAGGWRTAIHFVEAEHRRRIEAGEVGKPYEKLQDEADHLAEWVRKEHPKAPPLSSGRIQNAIREAHREWKSRGADKRRTHT